MTRTYVIAEAGVNHNGDSDLAFKLVETAASIGADAIKFQTFKSNKLVTKSADMADYQKNNTGKDESQHDMLRKLELDFDTFIALANRAQALGMDFISTAFDTESLSFITDTLGVTTLKVASGELTNGQFLLEHARSGLDLIVSTGMATLAEVEQALGVIAYGWSNPAPKSNPTQEDFLQAYMSPKLQDALHNKIRLLHCTTSYPTPPEAVNLHAMDTLRHAFGISTGYSDHTLGITVPIAAVARGATVIEKHFTLDQSMPGPDHKASLEPAQFTAMVDAIRCVEQAMGSTVKGPMPAEIEIMKAARKSLVAACNIAAGESFSAANLTAMRPGTGRSPMDYWALLERKAQRAYQAGDPIID